MWYRLRRWPCRGAGRLGPVNSEELVDEAAAAALVPGSDELLKADRGGGQLRASPSPESSESRQITLIEDRQLTINLTHSQGLSE